MSYLPMTSVIDLYVVEQIFGSNKISSQTRAIYINCLIHHFSGVPALEVHACQFSIGYVAAKFQKFQKNYDEMKQFGLISYSEREIVFIPHWNRFIDKERYGKNQRKISRPVEEYSDDLRNNSVIDLVAMRLKVSREEVLILCDHFILEKKTISAEYDDITSVVQHFMFWSAKPVNKELISKQKTVVKSNAKEL